MKSTVTIAGVKFGKVFQKETKSGSQIDVQLVNIITLESIKKFTHEDDEKVEISERKIAIDYSDFTRMIAVAGWLAYIPQTELTSEQKGLAKHEQDAIRYSEQVRLLNGARLTFNRNEITEQVFDESKPKHDANGDPVLDDNNEQVYEPLIGEDGKPVKKLVGYEKVEIVSIQLTPQAEELAKFKAMHA